jgi:hypothetical protein
MNRTLLTCLAGLAALVCGSTTTWAQTHIEVDDAGSTRDTAQETKGVGSLDSIQGSLDGGARGGEPDFIDMYLIHITDPEGFSMRTDVEGGGAVDFDSQLWLFELGPGPSDAFGLLGADEIDGATAGPTILIGPATDGTGQTIPAPGLYLVAISGFDHDPISPGGFIFDQIDRTEVSGPDGGGAFESHIDWVGPGETGVYNIALTGATFATPIPTLTDWGLIVLALLLVAAGGMVIHRNRRIAAKERA